jgi:hypothetical protein
MMAFPVLLWSRHSVDFFCAYAHYVSKQSSSIGGNKLGWSRCVEEEYEIAKGEATCFLTAALVHGSGEGSIIEMNPLSRSHHR